MEEIFRKKFDTLDSPPKVHLFVADIADFSTQYGKEQSKSYTVANLRAGPNHYPRYGDFLESCVFRTYGPWWNILSSNIKVPIQARPLFISQDFVEVVFETKLVVESIIVYETYHPGSVCALYAYDYFGNRWINIWSLFNDFNFTSNQQALNRNLPAKASRKFEPFLKRKDIFTDKLRIEFEHGKQDYYTELDAVEIVGYSHDGMTSRKIGLNLRQLADNFNLLNINQSKPKEIQKENQETFKAENKFDIKIDENTEPISTKTNTVFNNSRRKSSITAFNSLSLQVASAGNLLPKIQCSNIAELPNEILNIILSYLDFRTLFNLRATCKHFYDICSDEYFFQRLDLQPYWYLVNDDLIKLLTSLTNDIKMLNFSWLKLSSKVILEDFFVNSCQFLITLKLDNCLFVDEDVLKAIGENCKNLENLSLVGCMNNGNSIENNAHKNKFLHLKNLTKLIKLNLYRSAIDTDSIVIILMSCHYLKHLNLGSCINIIDFDLVMDVLSSYCKEMESLDLWRAYTLSNTGLDKIANNCVNLVELDIGWCRNVCQSFDFLKTLLIKCKNLKKLFLTSLRITDEELMFLSKHSPNIEQLDVLGSSISAEAAEAVLKNCKNLKMFDISFCSNTNMDLYAQLRDSYRNCSIKKSFQSDF